jgi:hypothetical protein
LGQDSQDLAALILDRRGTILASSVHQSGQRSFHGVRVGPVGSNLLEACEEAAQKKQEWALSLQHALTDVMDKKESYACFSFKAEGRICSYVTVTRVDGAASWLIVWLNANPAS